jgi:hypothetical protein
VKKENMKKLVFVLMGLVSSLVIVSHTTYGQNGSAEAVEVTDKPESENSVDFETTIDDELESERQLKRLLKYVTPLMAILRKNPFSRNDPSGRKNKKKYYDPYYDDFNLDRNTYDNYDRNGYGGGGGYCCQQKDDLLPLLALLGLAGLLLYLIVIASTTTAAPVRLKKRSEDEGNWILENDENIGKVICYSLPDGGSSKW